MQASAWTPEDRALMLAWRAYQASLCPGCGHPKETAWHPHMDGWFEIETAHTCHVCTALARHNATDPAAVEPTEYLDVVDTRPLDADPLPPLSEVMDLIRHGPDPVSVPGEE